MKFYYFHPLVYLRAKYLNKRLFAQTGQLPTQAIRKVTKQFKYFAKKRKYTKNDTQAYLGHLYRFYFSLNWLKTLLTGHERVLEMGTATPFTDILQKKYPKLNLIHFDADLRKAWPKKIKKLDVIVSMEVVEHLSDPFKKGLQDSWQKIGLQAVLKNSWQALKPGGYLFLTTPNSSSAAHLQNLTKYEENQVYPPHIHEYGFRELEYFLLKTGFEIKKMETRHCLTLDRYQDLTQVFMALLAANADVRFRGDDTFVIAQKPLQ